MDATTITAAGLESLDADGYDGLSMRRVATRLGVQVGALYYHVPDKAGLLRLMADEMCGAVSDEVEPTGSWYDDAVALCLAVRRTLLSRRDGARLFAQSPLVGSDSALGLMERLLGQLGQGIRPDRVAPAADTLFSYVTGYVLQEQLDEPATPADAPTLAAFQERFPLVFAASRTGAATGPETAFRSAVEAIIDGFAAPA